MPVIIEEVVISIDVTNNPAGGVARTNTNTSAEDQQRMVAECVERVMEILQQKRER
ncbi:MAG: DUF5908 family protein [Gemmatimonadaceae bacterium]